MTKKDLMTGDIIVNRSGYLGVILKDEDTVLYQFIGSDSLSDFTDALLFDDEDYRDGDIMQVYRENTFLDVDNDEGTPLFQRDFSWRRPTKEERQVYEKTIEEERKKRLEEMRESTELNKNDNIYIIAQQFYGNRTATEISRENIDFFLKGILSPEFFPGEDKTANRKVIKVPGTDNIAIVYDQNQEDEYVNIEFPEQYKELAEEYKEHTGREFKMQVSCKISEIDFEIHTRCFACRIDKTGELQSLEDGDAEKFINYFPSK